MPAALFAIRQQFHTAFRRAAGCFHGQRECRAGSDCPCHSVFGQQLATDPAALRLYQKPPLPFAFKIPLLPGRVERGKEVELSLVIVGEAISYLDLFVKATLSFFESAGAFSSWQVTSVMAACPDGSRTVLPSAAGVAEFSSLPLLSFDDPATGEGGSCSRIFVDFQTPLRLLHNGSPLQDISFSRFTGALFRRISSLAYYYGGEDLPHDFKWLAEKSRAVVCRHAAMSWTNLGGSLQGVTGTAEFTGELTDFIPFLLLGSRLNVGKGAAYGMGRYCFSAG